MTTKTGSAWKESTAVQQLLNLEQQHELEAFGQDLVQQGFSTVRRVLDDVRNWLRSFMDEEVDEAGLLLERLKTAIPDPGKISPSWQDLWNEFDGIVRYKSELLKRIPPDQRGSSGGGKEAVNDAHGTEAARGAKGARGVEDSSYDANVVGQGGTAEWQVLIDNPYSNQHIAVYPALSFQEAIYLYAYFRTSLEQNEYIRLQKIETVITNTGADD